MLPGRVFSGLCGREAVVPIEQIPNILTQDSDERLMLLLGFSPGTGRALRFGASNRALYLPFVRRLALTDPVAFHRVPWETIRELRLRRVVRTWLLLLSPVLLGGALLLGWLVVAEAGLEIRDALGYGAGLAVLGALMPVLAYRRRYALELVANDGWKYAWKPDFSVTGGAERRGHALCQILLSYAATRRVRVEGELQPPPVLLWTTHPGAVSSAERILPTGSRVALRGRHRWDCLRCGVGLERSAWEERRGLLCRCPACGQLTGKAWNFSRVQLSFVLNLLSYFMVYPAKTALVWAVLQVALWIEAFRAMAGDTTYSAFALGLAVLLPPLVVGLQVGRQRLILEAAAIEDERVSMQKALASALRASV